MNRNPQENRSAPGSGRSKNPRNVPSQTERQDRRGSQDSGSRQANASGTGGGDRRVRQQTNADARDPHSEPASARFDDARTVSNPARESEGGEPHPERGLPGID